MSAAPARGGRSRRRWTVLILLSTVVGAAVAFVMAVLVSEARKPAPQPLRAGSYVCTRPDAHGGPPRPTGAVLEPLGPRRYWVHPDAGSDIRVVAGTGGYSVSTIEQGQYDMRFDSGPLRGARGDYVMLARGSAVVSYVVLAGGSVDGVTCTLH